MSASADQINAMSAIFAECPGHVGQTFTEHDQALIKTMVSRLATPFSFDIRTDRMIASIAGCDGDTAVFIAKVFGTAYVLQVVNGETREMWVLPSLVVAIDAVEQSYKLSDGMAIH